MTAVSRRAHAKINLLLSVGSALPADHARAGYHPILSWMHAIDLHDDVRVERLADGAAPQLDLAWAEDAPRTTPIDWKPDDDLAMKALRALERDAGRSLPAKITIRKRIPVGGGLGGGSGNAAAALLGLREVFGLDVAGERIAAIGASIGSDVPFFLDTGHAVPAPAIISGLGEAAERTARMHGGLVLVIPPYGCETRAVYAAFDRVREAELREAETRRLVHTPEGQQRSAGPRENLVTGRAKKMQRLGRIEADQLVNELARPAFEVEPRLGKLVTLLSNATRTPAHVTGSGSCVFLVPRPGKEEWMLERVRRAAEGLDEGERPVAMLTELV